MGMPAVAASRQTGHRQGYVVHATSGGRRPGGRGGIGIVSSIVRTDIGPKRVGAGGTVSAMVASMVQPHADAHRIQQR